MTTIAPRAGLREWIALGFLALPAFVLAIDVSVLHLALPHIVADLNATSGQQLWILDIYGFLMAGFLVTMGTLGDRVGRRRMLLIGSAAFAVLSVVAALSVTTGMLITARALLGLAGAVIMPSTLSLIKDLFGDGRQRAIAIAVWTACFSSGMALGPALGGVILEWFWWGAVLLAAVPFMVVVLIGAPFVLPEHRGTSTGRIDLLSVGLSLTAILPLVYSVKTAAQYGWSASVLVSVLSGLAFGWLFLRRQRRLSDPLLDLTLFRDRVFSAGLSTFLLASVTMGALGFVFAQYLQLVRGMSPGEAGMWMVPYTVSGIVTVLIAPIVAQRIGERVTIMGGLVLAAAGFVAFAQSGQSLTLSVAGAIAVCVGLSPLLVLTNDMVISSAPKDKSGSAASVFTMAGEIGAAWGIAVLGAVVTVVYRGATAGALPAGLSSADATAASDSLAGAVTVADRLPEALSDRLLHVATEGFNSGLAMFGYLSAALLVVLTVTAGLFLRRPAIVPAPGYTEAS